MTGKVSSSVGDPDPQDPYVFGSPESGFISQTYGSRSYLLTWVT
jgi:hypothetical protein